MFFKKNFSDLDEMLESLIGWDLDFLPLEKGKFPSRIGQYMFTDTFIGEASFTKRVEQRGSTPPGYRTFVIPKDDLVNYHWRGREIDGQTLSLFPPDGELYSVSNGSFRIFTISFSIQLLERVLQEIKSGEIETWLKSEHVWKVSSQKLQSIIGLIGKLLSSSVAPVVLSVKNLEFRLASEILNSMKTDRVSLAEKTVRRDRALVKCLDMIQSLRHEGILSLPELCRHAKVSERTLQYAFKERYGLSPKQYIKNYNLRGVRKALKNRSQGTNIREIASEYGFWHMGQFAADYKNHFGELPSQSFRWSRDLSDSSGHFKKI